MAACTFIPEDEAGSAPERAALAQLPDWYVENRVQLHWEGSLSIAEREGGAEGRFRSWLAGVQQSMNKMGARVWVGLAKRGGEGAWWPSGVGEAHPLSQDRELFREFFHDPAEAMGMRFIAYYRHDIDLPVQMAHPEWRALDAKGQPYESYRHEGALMLSYFSPYRDFVRERLVELAERGVDGVYFDSFHMHSIDTSAYARVAFEARYGRSFPETIEPYSEDFVAMARLVSEQLRASFAEWKKAVHEVNPEIVFIAGATPMVEFNGLHHNERMPESIDSQKIEFQKCFGGQQHFEGAPIQRLVAKRPEYWLPPRSLQESVAWRIARDVAHGRPAHLWNFKPAAEYGETMHTNLAIVASGNISSAHVDFSQSEAYQPLFEMNRRLGEVFPRLQPWGSIALHVSEALLVETWVAPDEETSYQQRYERLYAPVLGAAQIMEQNHLPFRMTFDSHLTEGHLPDEVAVILTPDRAALPQKLREALQERERNGLRIIDLSDPGDWQLAKRLPQLQLKLLDELERSLGPAPIRIEASPDLRSFVFRNPNDGRLLVTLVEDWNDFWFFGDKGSRRADLPIGQPNEGVILHLAPSSLNAELRQIDWQGDVSLAPIQSNGLSYRLPPWSIYQFIEILDGE